MSTYIGIMGAGEHGVRHLESARQLGLVLAAVCDPSAENAALAMAAAGQQAPVFSSSQEFFDKTILDAVIITSPDGTHADYFLEAARAGCHVLVDKPVATNLASLATAREAVALAARNGTKILTCPPRFFDKAYQWIKEQLPRLKEKYGELLHITFDFCYPEPETQGKHADLLTDHGFHELHALRWYVGDHPLWARRIRNNPRSYAVTGAIGEPGKEVGFTFIGTREGERIPDSNGKLVYPEKVSLRFAKGECTVYTTGGIARFDNNLGGTEWTVEVPRTDHDLRLVGVMRDFARAITTDYVGAVPPSEILFMTEVIVSLVEHGRCTVPDRPC